MLCTHYHVKKVVKECAVTLLCNTCVSAYWGVLKPETKKESSLSFQRSASNMALAVTT